MESKSESIELRERKKGSAVETTESIGREDYIAEDHDGHVSNVDNSMNATKWMACIALCLSYTTAIQQHSCTATIVKHIDIALGTSLANLY
jgi:hypothetical protein